MKKQGTIPIPNGVKIAVAVVALAGAGFFVWRSFSHIGPAEDDSFTTMPRYFTCAASHDFTTTSEEMRRVVTANDGIMLCTQCKSPAVEKFKCPKCSKFGDFVGFGQTPPVCPFCNAKFE
ncbi:MAG: hypothetical protein IT435_06305 [Phycisphaerales bacterium]|nr:hypothetical protein [Phycisphaerales bacterium]